MLRSLGHKPGHVLEIKHQQHYRQRSQRRPVNPVSASAMNDDRLQVVFVTTEVAPWSKVGGLADVIAALPAALAARQVHLPLLGHSVMTVAPRYEPYPEVFSTGIKVPVLLPHADSALAPAPEHKLAPEDQQPQPTVAETPHPPQRRRRGRRRKAEQRAFEAATAIAADLAARIASEPAQQSGHVDLALPTPPDEAELFSTHQGGVHRVFIDHPLLHTTNIYSFGGQSGGSLTYLEAGSESDLHIRYSVLCQGALAAAALIHELSPEEALQQRNGDFHSRRRIVFVANDWPTSLLLLQLRYALQRPREQQQDHLISPFEATLAERLAHAATVMCIHNLAYQGTFPSEAFGDLCLPQAAMGPLCVSTPWQDVLLGAAAASTQLHTAKNDVGGDGGGSDKSDVPCACGSIHPLEQACGEGAGAISIPAVEESASVSMDCAGGLNFMRAALLTCNEVVTVSPNYAEEIQRDADMGCGMQDILTTRGVVGIMNGIDVDEWNPSNDHFLPLLGRFNATAFLEGKAHMKALVQERLGLDRNPDAALLVFIGRLTQQKGVDVLLGALPSVLAGNPAPAPQIHSGTVGQSNKGAGGKIQVALLGTGEAWMQAALCGLERSFPGQAAGATAFSEELAHWLLAAADYVLVPSRFEPCGLVAQCGARYGAVPIVTAVGGLKDLVVPGVGHALPPLSPPGDGDGLRQDIQRLAAAINLAGEESGGLRHRDMQRTCMGMDLSWDKPAEEWEELLQRVAQRAAGNYSDPVAPSAHEADALDAAPTTSTVEK